MAKINANKGRGTMIINEKTKDRKDVEKVLYFGLSGVSREKGDVSDCVHSAKERR